MIINGRLLIETRNQTAGSWGAWSEWGVLEYSTQAAMFEALDFSPLTIATGGDGDDAEARFTVQIPVACKVIYRLDSYDSNTSTLTEGTPTEANVMPGTPFTIAAGPGSATVTTYVKLVGIIWHPWT